MTVLADAVIRGSLSSPTRSLRRWSIAACSRSNSPASIVLMRSMSVAVVTVSVIGVLPLICACTIIARRRAERKPVRPGPRHEEGIDLHQVLSGLSGIAVAAFQEYLFYTVGLNRPASGPPSRASRISWLGCGKGTKKGRTVGEVVVTGAPPRRDSEHS